VVKKQIQKNQKKFQKQNIKLLCSSHSLVAVEKLSVSPKLSSVVFKSFCDLQSVFLPLILWKYISQKANGAPQKQGTINVANLSD
jgi:hypothetical protein